MSIERADAEAWVGAGLTAIYQRLQQGLDVSPGQRLRLEGQVDLLLQFGLLDRDQLQGLVESLYRQHCGARVDPAFWAWQREEGRFMLPVTMWVAPVR